MQARKPGKGDGSKLAPTGRAGAEAEPRSSIDAVLLPRSGCLCLEAPRPRSLSPSCPMERQAENRDTPPHPKLYQGPTDFLSKRLK